MASFPASIVSNTDPTSGNTLNNPDHAQLHQSHNAEAVAIETKLGTGASMPTTGKVLRATGTGTSAWGQVALSTDVGSATSADLRGVLSDETGSGVAVFGTSPTLGTPTITTPAVSGGTFATPILTTPQVITSLNDSNGNEIIKTPATASATNEITITNAANGSAPKISSTGSSDTNVNLNLIGKGTGSVQINGTDILTPFFDHVVSGCVWTADAAGSTLLASMTAGVVCIGGNFLTVAAVNNRAFTASKDTYVDVSDNGDGTGLIAYDASTANNGVSVALAASSMRLGIIVAGAGNIATAASINQGQETRILPIASSIPYAVTDSLGNLICPRDPNRRTLGLRIITANVTTTSTSVVQATGLTVPVIVPTGRKVKITYSSESAYTSGAGLIRVSIWDGTVGSGAQLMQYGKTPGTAETNGITSVVTTTPTTTSKTYNIGFFNTSAGTATMEAGAALPTSILVELA